MVRALQALVGVGVLACGGAALAAVPVSNLTAAPTQDVITSSITSTESGFSIRWRSPGGNAAADTDGGQVFTVPIGLDQTLQSITVRIGAGQTGSFNSGAAGLPLIFDFFSYNGTTFTPLFRESATLPLTAVAGQYLQFDLSSKNQLLTAGTQYAFMIGSNVHDTSAGEVNNFRLASDASDIYGGGFEIRRDNIEYGSESRPALSVLPNVLNSGRDIVFAVQASPVPEPATALLSLAAAALLAGRPRRR